jgi:flavorubredoxin
MQTNIHEIADGVYRLSTVVPEVAPGGFAFNQYLIDGDEPLLFHTGGRELFPLVAEAVGKVIEIPKLRWVSFGHVESDECGSMNQWLAAAPSAEVTFNPLGVMVSLNDLADRPPVPLVTEDQGLDLGGHVVQVIPTPHVPHGWEAQVLFDETTRTLFCGDLFTQTGDRGAIVADDVVQAALDGEDLFGATALTANTAPTMRRLAALEPRTLALMHGPAYAGDGQQALLDLADAYEERFTASLDLAAVA